MYNLQIANTKSDLYYWIDAYNPFSNQWVCVSSAINNTDALNQVEVLRDTKPACWRDGKKAAISYRVTICELDGNRLLKVVS